MKKRISLVMALVLIVSMFSAMTASAAVSPATGRYTVVDAMINEWPIQAFEINNQTVVDTEDLTHYGFSVIWDGFARSLYISRAVAMREEKLNRADYWTPASMQAIIRDYKAYAGEVAFTCEPSDIRVFIDGEEVVCYVSNGMTFIQLKDLVKATVPETAWGYNDGCDIGHFWNPETLQSHIYLSNEDLRKVDEIITADNALLTYEKANEIAKAWLANSVYAPYATMEADFDRVLAQEFVRGASIGNAYSFNLFFDGFDMTIPVYVTQTGAVIDSAIPTWITFFCTNF